MSIAEPRLREKNGVVYTKAWVADLILDLAGYAVEANLVDALAVEPAAGDGAFAVPMARRLVMSCCRQKRSLADCADALLVYEVDEASGRSLSQANAESLVALGMEQREATALVRSWLRIGDYLSDAPSLPVADYILGNPPYIRLEDMDADTAAAYRARYRTMMGRADIYVAFFEAALRQLKPGGVCAFICADRWMLNQYGAALRRLVTAHYGVEAVVEMHQADAFAHDVSAYPAITVIRRGKQGPVVVASADGQAKAASSGALAQALQAVRASGTHGPLPAGLAATRADAWFSGNSPWPCVSPERLTLLQRLEQEFYPLEAKGTGTVVSIGVATGCDDVYITLDPDLVEPSRLLPLAMANDTDGGQLNWSGHYLVNPWTPQGLVNLAHFPRLAAYYERHREALMSRHVAKNKPLHWYRTIDRVNHSLLSRHKLYIPDIKDRITPVLDRGETYPHHNLYVIYSDGWDVEALGGLLLSAVGQFFVSCYGVRMRGGYLRFQAQYLRRIRVPRPFDLSPVQIQGLADAFRRHDREAATRLALDIYRIDSGLLEACLGP